MQIHLKNFHLEINFSVHLPSVTPFFSILFDPTKLFHQSIYTSMKIELNDEIEDERVQETNSFFFVLKRMSPKARDTDMSPQILPLTICIREISGFNFQFYANGNT